MFFCISIIRCMSSGDIFCIISCAIFIISGFIMAASCAGGMQEQRRRARNSWVERSRSRAVCRRLAASVAALFAAVAPELRPVRAAQRRRRRQAPRGCALLAADGALNCPGGEPARRRPSRRCRQIAGRAVALLDEPGRPSRSRRTRHGAGRPLPRRAGRAPRDGLAAIEAMLKGQTAAGPAGGPLAIAARYCATTTSRGSRPSSAGHWFDKPDDDAARVRGSAGPSTASTCSCVWRAARVKAPASDADGATAASPPARRRARARCPERQPVAHHLLRLLPPATARRPRCRRAPPTPATRCARAPPSRGRRRGRPAAAPLAPAAAEALSTGARGGRAGLLPSSARSSTLWARPPPRRRRRGGRAPPAPPTTTSTSGCARRSWRRAGAHIRRRRDRVRRDAHRRPGASPASAPSARPAAAAPAARSRRPPLAGRDDGRPPAPAAAAPAAATRRPSTRWASTAWSPWLRAEGDDARRGRASSRCCCRRPPRRPPPRPPGAARRRRLRLATCASWKRVWRA